VLANELREGKPALEFWSSDVTSLTLYTGAANSAEPLCTLRVKRHFRIFSLLDSRKSYCNTVKPVSPSPSSLDEFRLQAIRPHRAFGQRRQPHPVPWSFLVVVDIVVRYRRVGSDTIVPKRNRARCPLDAHLEVLPMRYVLFALVIFMKNLGQLP
jgi:hypothetical protein